ncbi:MAG: MFS transporter [Candidatus Nitrotoga sp.]
MSHKQPENKGPALFKDSSFKWLLSGSALSMLGDQFTLIAMPWLVLKMTEDTLALGIALALIGVPRALFMLIGGALVDRYSAKRVLMLTKYINTFLLGLLAILVLSNSLSIWMVYVLSLAIGLATAFSIPSGSAILPLAVKAEQLQSANGMMLGLRQVTMFVGPLLAGLLIALFNDKSAGIAADSQGLGVAFLLDALSFAISAFTLAKVAVCWNPVPADSANQAHLLKSVAENLRYCWSDVDLRTCFLYWAAIALFISGPIQVALPVLANTMSNGVAAFGILMGAHGAGTLVGMIISGVRPNLRVGSLGMTILAVDIMIGLLIIPMGAIHSTWVDASILLAIGMLGGFVQVAVYTWMQRRVPAFRMGRTMSLFMFIFMGIAPVSAALTGWLMRSVSVGELFAGSGMLLLAIASITLVASPMRTVSDLPLKNEAA